MKKPVSKAQLTRNSATLLKEGAARLKGARALVGFDGFVDTILHAVDQRASASRYTRITKMADFAKRIEAAAGLSANIELVPQLVKLGGNGPIMANALNSLGAPVQYVGNLGAPHLHSVFEDFAKKVEVLSVAEPGYTDAIEFEDGKLMCGKLTSLGDVNWPTLVKHLPEEQLLSAISQSTLIALVNWTMLPHMSSIFQRLLTDIAPKLTGEKRWMFFDLADPAKRTRKDLAAVLRLISRFQRYFRVVLGLNLQESRQVGEVLGLKPLTVSESGVQDHASRLQERLALETVVVHPTAFAAAADADTAAVVKGPFVHRPKITTGAGDHFNAGFCVGRVLGADLAGSLRLGVATSGYYVRTARSPRLAELRKFLEQV